MPGAAQVDYGAIASDPTFQTMPLEQQRGYLSTVDDTFKKMQPDDQTGYINHLLGPERLNRAAQSTQFEQERAGAPKTNTEVVEQAASAPLHAKFWQSAGDELESQAKGAIPMLERSGNPIAPAVNAYEGAKGAYQNWQNRKAAGRSLPYRALTGAADAAGVPTGAQGEEEAADKGDVPGVMGHAAVPAAEAVGATAIPKGIEAANAARTGLAHKLIQPMVYEGPGEAMADTRFGQVPERGIVNEGITGTKQGMIDESTKRVGELKQQLNQTLQTHRNANIEINATPHIDAAIDDAIDKAKKDGAPTERLEHLRTAMKSEYGPTKGTPFQMNELKSKLQDRADAHKAYGNTQPEEGTIADTLSDAAQRIKNSVNKAVPEAAPINQRMSDLMDANKALTRKVAQAKGEDLLAGDVTSIPTRLARRTIGSAPVRSHLANILTAGIKDRIPPPSGSGYAPPTYAPPDISSAEAVPYNRLARVPGRTYREATPPLVTPPTTAESRTLAVEPQRGVQRGPSGRMQRYYKGVGVPETAGQTAEGGPIKAPEPSERSVARASGPQPPRLKESEVRELSRVLGSPDASLVEKSNALHRLRQDEAQYPKSQGKK